MTTPSSRAVSSAWLAITPRVIFTTEAASAVVASARFLLSELLDEHILPVNRARAMMRGGSWPAQRRAEVVTGLGTALRVAHDGCATDFFWPTPQEASFHLARRSTRSDYQ